MFGRLFLAALFLGVISGCTNFDAIAENARTEMIGFPKDRLLSCAGVPIRETRHDNAEYLSYTGQMLVGGKGAVVSINCVATFILREGRINKITFTGTMSQCGRMMQSCVK